MKTKSLFSKATLAAAIQKRVRGALVSDMAAAITEHASMFSDSHAGMRVLMEISGYTMPAIFSDAVSLRFFAARGFSESKSAGVSAANVFSRISVQTRSMMLALGKTSSGSEYKISPEIFEKTNRLSSQLGRLERLLAQQPSAQAADKKEVLAAIDAFEAAALDVWLSANSNLREMLALKAGSIALSKKYFWAAFGALLAAALAAAWLLSRSIVAGLAGISEVISFAGNGNVQAARAAYENGGLSSTKYGELNESVRMLVNYMGELIDISKNIANVSNRINLMLNGLAATKTPLIVSIKDAFGEANKQIRADYEFVMQSAAKLAESAAVIIGIELNVKNSKKLGASLRENLSAISNCSGLIFGRLNESRAQFDKLAAISASLGDAAEKINLLGLNLSIAAQKMGAHSEGAETISAQIRSASRQIAVSAADIEAVGASITRLVADSQADNSKIAEISESSSASSSQIEGLSGKVSGEISNMAAQLSGIASALRSNISSRFDSDSSIQDLDDIKDSLKDMAAIVNKSSENVDAIRSRFKAQ